MGPSRLNLRAIEASLEAAQAGFADVNHSLSTERDPMTDEVRANMLAGYRCVDEALALDLDLFKLGNSAKLLELNTLILCGTGQQRRKDYARHISATEKRFYEQEGGGIKVFMEWMQRHGGEDVWRRAAGAYIHILSRPELFIEGNHRTGALIMSYMLAREGRPPFVLTAANARAYFEPSTIAKTTKRVSLKMLIRSPRLKRRLTALLRETADERLLLDPGQAAAD